MTVRHYTMAALMALVPATVFGAEESLRGSPASMSRQHDVAVEEELTFHRTPAAVLAEVRAGTLRTLPGNSDYRIANVSFAYAVPEVRMLVERLAAQYHAACGEPLVVTSLTRPKVKQPRNAHVLSVHPAGMAVDLRISKKAACRSWLESTLLSLESAGVLDVTRERRPPHYHVAVFPTPYREYVERMEALKPKPVLVQVQQSAEPMVAQAAVAALPTRRDDTVRVLAMAAVITITSALTGLAALRKKRAQR